MHGGVNGVSDKEPATDLLIKTGKRTKQAGYFCAAGLEIDQTKGGPDALYPVPHSSSLRGNPWRDGSPLQHCSVDAEHLVTSSIFWGSTGRLIRTPMHELSIWAWGFMPHTWMPQNPSRKDL